MEDELWLPIAGHAGAYKISNLGRVWSVRLNRMVSPRPTKRGYMRVSLNRKERYVHRLVALAFIPNAEALPEVNHRNGNKSDNSVQNLEWCSSADNKKHATENHLKYQRPVMGFHIDSGEIVSFSTATDAMRDGFDVSHIHKSCKASCLPHQGFLWWYADDKSHAALKRLLGEYAARCKGGKKND